MSAARQLSLLLLLVSNASSVTAAGATVIDETGSKLTVINAVVVLLAVVGFGLFVFLAPGAVRGTAFQVCPRRDRPAAASGSVELVRPPVFRELAAAGSAEGKEFHELVADGPAKGQISNKLKAVFAFLSFAYMFPYHAMMQTMGWYGGASQRELASNPPTQTILMLSLFWPMFFIHLVDHRLQAQWTAAAKRLARWRRLASIEALDVKALSGVACFVVVILITFFLVNSVVVTSQMFAALVVMFLLFSTAECMVEPSVMSLAARINPQYLDSVQLGNGLCGVAMPLIVLGFQRFLFPAANGEALADEHVSFRVQGAGGKEIGGALGSYFADNLKEFEMGGLSSEGVATSGKTLGDLAGNSLTEALLAGNSSAVNALLKPIRKQLGDLSAPERTEDFAHFHVDFWNDDLESQKRSVVLLLGVGAAVGALLALAFVYVRWTEKKSSAGRSQVAPGEASDADAGVGVESIPGEAPVEVSPAVWAAVGPSIWAQFLIFAASLSSWPSALIAIGDQVTLNEKFASFPFEGQSRTFWIQCAFAAYNLPDFLGRLTLMVCPAWNIWKISPNVQLMLAYMRFGIVAVMQFVMRGEDTNIYKGHQALALMAVIGFSNGLLSGISIRTPKVKIDEMVPAAQRDAVSDKVMHVMVGALFCGLAVGSCIALFISDVA